MEELIIKAQHILRIRRFKGKDPVGGAGSHLPGGHPMFGPESAEKSEELVGCTEPGPAWDCSYLVAKNRDQGSRRGQKSI